MGGIVGALDGAMAADGNTLRCSADADADATPLHVVKNIFKHKKTRYRGLAKNEAQLFSLFGLANLFLARRPLLALHAGGAS